MFTSLKVGKLTFKLVNIQTLKPEDMETIGRYLMFGGIAIFLLGGGIYLAAKFGIPLGRLPGDIRIERDGFSFYFPLASSILVSIVLTIVLNVILRLMKK